MPNKYSLPRFDTLLKGGLFASALVTVTYQLFKPSMLVSAQPAGSASEDADDAKQMANFMSENFGKTAAP